MLDCIEKLFDYHTIQDINTMTLIIQDHSLLANTYK